MPRPPAGRPAARPGAALVAASLALFLVDLDFFALNLAVPAIAQNLRVSVTDLQWVISGYMLALGAFLIPGGRLGDILGRRRTLIAGVALFSGASTVCGVVDSADVVIGFRLVQGIGAAIIFPICVAVVTNAFPGGAAERAIGNLYGLAAVAVAVGPFFGGFITEAVSWRAVFLVNLPLGVAAIALALWGIRESRDETVPTRSISPGSPRSHSGSERSPSGSTAARITVGARPKCWARCSAASRCWSSSSESRGAFGSR
jgi:MFS family permease